MSTDLKQSIPSIIFQQKELIVFLPNNNNINVIKTAISYVII